MTEPARPVSTYARGARGAGRARPVRDPPRPRADAGAAARARRPAASGPRRADRRHERQGQRPGPRRSGAAGGRATASARRPSRTSSPTASGSRSTGGRSRRTTSPASSARSSPPPTGSPGATATPTEFELLTAVVFALLRRGPARPRARRGRPRRAARCDPCLGRRRGRDHERRPRPHGPARRHDHRRSPARRPRSSSAATWR